MNIPNFASCHHCIRRTWSAVGEIGCGARPAGALTAEVTCAASADGEAPIAASAAPEPASIWRRVIVFVFIMLQSLNLGWWKVPDDALRAARPKHENRSPEGSIGNGDVLSIVKKEFCGRKPFVWNGQDFIDKAYISAVEMNLPDHAPHPVAEVDV